MDVYKSLLEGNKQWVQEKLAEDSNFFERLAKGQSPEILWIGCSDSRVPANEITRTQPGDIFVHRNIANMVIHTDINMLSVLDYAVNILKVKHIIVCGHYGCGGVNAAMENQQFGLIDNWLRHLKDVYKSHHRELNLIQNKELRQRRFVELNIMEQVHDLSETSIVQNAWNIGQPVSIHGWVYDIHNGLLKDLNVTCMSVQDVHPVYHIEENKKMFQNIA